MKDKGKKTWMKDRGEKTESTDKGYLDPRRWYLKKKKKKGRILKPDEREEKHAKPHHSQIAKNKW